MNRPTAAAIVWVRRMMVAGGGGFANPCSAVSKSTFIQINTISLGVVVVVANGGDRRRKNRRPMKKITSQFH